jgi:L-lactate dehydrogenase complex protein LldG
MGGPTVERDAFLARVRERLADVEAPSLPEELPPTFNTGDGRLFDRFAEELQKVGGEARSVKTYEIADAFAEIAAGCSTAVVASGVGSYLSRVEEGLRRAGCESVEPAREFTATADLGVTGAALGVASTGSILLPMGPDAPRVVSLLPPLHVALLDDDRLLPGFEELFEEFPRHAAERAQTVLITGPSRTGDIELQLVRGVHGPVRVIVLVVST